ncbi:OB-fold nucleic acid binding domain-containing protein, partial [candidate division KSB1 bacterium]
KNHPVTEKMYKNIIKMCKRIAGFPRYLSVHPGGVIIAPDEITNYTALEISGKGLVISQHDMRAVEKLGLVKMDILGVRGLSVITDCLKDVASKNEKRGENIRRGNLKYLESIKKNDKETMKMIMQGRTVGCFQLESPAMRGLLKKMQVQVIKDVIDAVAVIRPGPSEAGMKDAFIRRRAGVEKPEYIHPVLKPILRETYGVVVYQEQVLRIAKAVAGFSYGEADLLRRAMTKSRKSEVIKPLKKKFIEGAAKKGIQERSADEIWRFMENFVGYGFNKAHSATYGILAYKSAYLKYHHPVPFMTAVLNNGGGFYSMAAYIEEARRMGIKIAHPDVNNAEKLFTSKGKTITCGLFTVLKLSDKSMKRLISERKKSPYKDIFDFLDRSGIMQTEAINLAKCGALRSIMQSEAEAITIIKVYFRNNRKINVTRKLIDGLNLPPNTQKQKIMSELEILGFAVSGHPLSLFSEIEFNTHLTTSVSLEKMKDRQIKTAAWMVTSRRAPTSSGKYVKFATLEDKEGLMEAVLFPDVYEKYGKILRGYGPFYIKGTVQSRVQGESNIIVESVQKIKDKEIKKTDYKIFDRDLEDDMFFDVA